MERYIDFKTYKDKLEGCWWGKVAGGTLGAPFEGKRAVFDVPFYAQEDPSGIPNDDVDFQLVSLCACEKYHHLVDSKILAEYWLSLVSVRISEYGAAINNLRNHLLPPLSGKMNNPCSDSNAAFIRSEIWACLCAGNPDIAAHYALEDACVDHVCEGVYGEVFCAVMEAYAFIESDVNKLIDKALSYIPEDCGLRKAVDVVRECYQKGMSWQEARYELLYQVPGSFGIAYSSTKPQGRDTELPLGKPYYDVPSNVGLAVLGLLYGEGDFEKTIVITNNCGEDTDCTAGFAGAVIGIILGRSNLPEKWIKPLGSKIVTCCLGMRDDARYPKTVEQLCERILRLTPLFLGTCVDVLTKDEGYRVKVLSNCELLAVNALRHKGNPDLKCMPIKLTPDFKPVLERVGETVGVKHNDILFDTTVFYPDGCEIELEKPLTLRFEIWNRIYEQQQLKLRWLLPEGVEIVGGNYRSVFLDQIHGGFNEANFSFEVICRHTYSDEIPLVLEIASIGRATKSYIPITLLVK